MSILIKGMEKPKSCAICHFERDGFPDEWEMHCLLLHRKVGYYGNNLRMPTSCPIVEVPTPHGRLIDADWTREEIDKDRPGRMYEDAWALTVMDNSPTIIEAEKGDKNE